MPNPSDPGRGGPPRYPTRFVGRRTEVSAVRALLQPGRLVTVVGLGGAGKTRLTARVAGDHHCVWVDLATANAPSDVAGGVAEALGLPPGGGDDPTAGVVNTLREQPTLLVLDNCEVQGAACRELVDTLLAETDALTVLATSREPLTSAYEWLYLLPPLEEGGELFADRAARVGYAPSAQEVQAVTELCHLVGGLPLAIELLAAWCHVRSPAELLQSQLEQLSSRTATVLPRHRDMTAVLDASMALLTADQRRVLAALGVFAGGFTAEAAESVAETDLDTLATLVERGLLSRDAVSGRFRVHELVRSDALSRLRSVEGGREDAVRRRHFDYFATLAEPWTDHAAYQREPYDNHPLMAENSNLNAARRWAVQRGDANEALRLVQALDLFWPYAIPPKPRRLERLAAVLALPYDSTDRTVLLNRGWACETAGQLTIKKQPALARTWFEESLRHFRAIGHQEAEADALRGLAEASVLASELDVAEAYINEARDVVRCTADRPGEAWTHVVYAMIALARHQPERAAGCVREARRVFEERGADYGSFSAYGIFSADYLLGETLYAQGCYADAVAAYGSALSIQERTGFVREVEDLLEDVAILAAALGAHEQAAGLLGAAATWRAIDADPRPFYGMADYRSATAASRRSLGPRRWQAAFDTGARLTSRQAIGLARSTLEGLRVRASAGTLGLTVREREVLSLIADGSHDQEVAERLQLSPRTVQAHLRSVYAKLEVTTRTAAVHRAAELGLIDPVPD